MSTLDLRRKVEMKDEPPGTGIVETEAHVSWSRGGVALLSLADPDALSYDRDFLSADEKQLSRAGNGSLSYRDLPPGIFEGRSVWRSYREHVVYFSVTDSGRIDVLGDEDEVRIRLGGLPLEEARRLQDARRDAEAEEAAQRARDAGFRDLEGTNKQIRWASEIRDVAVNASDYGIALALSQASTERGEDARPSECRVLLDAYCQAFIPEPGETGEESDRRKRESFVADGDLGDVITALRTYWREQANAAWWIERGKMDGTLGGAEGLSGFCSRALVDLALTPRRPCVWRTVTWIDGAPHGTWHKGTSRRVGVTEGAMIFLDARRSKASRILEDGTLEGLTRPAEGPYVVSDGTYEIAEYGARAEVRISGDKVELMKK